MTARHGANQHGAARRVAAKHQAVLYASREELLDTALPYLCDGVARGEHVPVTIGVVRRTHPRIIEAGAARESDEFMTSEAFLRSQHQDAPLAELRSGPDGTTVRLHVTLA